MRKNPQHTRRRSEHGFTLMELMIVIAIIGILVGVGVYGWKQGIRRANENASIQQLEALRKIQADYSIGHRGDYGTFEQLVKAGSIEDERFATSPPSVQGYIYTMEVIPAGNGQRAFYKINADPMDGGSGTNHFYIDPDVSTIRVNPEKAAAPTDPPLTK
jgi:prepilin-type N-terminal cleavage/methylation domain-containing protein